MTMGGGGVKSKKIQSMSSIFISYLLCISKEDSSCFFLHPFSASFSFKTVCIKYFHLIKTRENYCTWGHALHQQKNYWRKGRVDMLVDVRLLNLIKNNIAWKMPWVSHKLILGSQQHIYCFTAKNWIGSLIGLSFLLQN